MAHLCPDCNKSFKNIQGYLGHRAIVHNDHTATHTKVKSAVLRCFRLRGLDDNTANQVYTVLEGEVDRLQSLPRDQWSSELSRVEKVLASIPKQPVNTTDQGADQGPEGDAGMGWAVLGGAALVLWLLARQPKGG